MFIHSGKYKTLLISSLLLAYLASNFHRPFLEGLHQVSHLAQQLLIPFESQPHTHYESHVHPHVHEGHQHPLINSLSQILTWLSDEPDTEHHAKKPLKKKKPELKPIIQSIAFSYYQNSSKPVKLTGHYLSFFLSTPIPPPRV